MATIHPYVAKINNFLNIFTLGEMLSFPSKSSLFQSEDKACKEPGTSRSFCLQRRWAEATVFPPQLLHLPWPVLSLPPPGQVTQETARGWCYESSVHSRSPHQENNWDWGPVRMILGFLPQADGAWCQGVKPGTSPQWVAAPSNLTACPAAQEKSGALGTPNSLLMRSGGVTRSLIYLYGEPPL